MDILLNNNNYKKELKAIYESNVSWQKLKNKTLMVSGATGMIGKMMIDALLYSNERDNLNITIIALGRSRKKAGTRFPEYTDRSDFIFIETDINSKSITEVGKIDYVFHLASSTHPKQYASEPIETILANITGLKNMLDASIESKAERVLFSSSVEVYGENRGDVERFDEKYLGYIDCNSLRAGYPESKRAGESLCQAYRSQKGIEIVIARLARVFGPTMLLSDSKASSQFIMSAAKKENIVLKSDGMQHYSYIYVRDAVIALLTCMLDGDDGEVYNVANEGYDIRLKDLANYLASIAGSNVIFEQPDDLEKNGYSKATKALMGSKKIQTLGFRVCSNIQEDLKNTVSILKDCNSI